MSTPETTPRAMPTVTPHLICAGAADAIEFYKKAFGAVEYMRIPTPEGKLMHGSVQIGDSMVMLVDEMPEWDCLGPKTRGGTSVTIHLSVPNVDELFAQAVSAGATPIMPPADMFWGDRYSQVQDPFGHKWSIATRIKDMTPEEMLEASRNANCGPEN